MKETEQQLGILPADPRLFAPHIQGPADCGTLVCDFQPTGEPCMGTRPGDFEGRTARLQSMMRVVAMPQGGFVLGSGEGNGVAWNLAPSALDGLQGSGMVWAAMQGGGGGPTTGGPGDVVPTTGPRSSRIGGGVGPVARNGIVTGQGQQRLSGAQSVCDTGDFQPARRGGFGVAFMDRTASGPFHAGHADDKHNLGFDRDGNPMNAGHIDTNAYFYRSQDEDGPLFFEGPYPYPPPYPLISRVHLTWDPALAHSFVGGARFGQWRWYAEVPFLSPQGNDPPGQQPPTTGTPPGPSTPGPARPGPGTPTPGAPGRPTTPGGGQPGRPTTPTPTPRGPTTGGGGGGDPPADPGDPPPRGFTGPGRPIQTPGAPSRPITGPTGPSRPGPAAPLPVGVGRPAQNPEPPGRPTTGGPGGGEGEFRRLSGFDPNSGEEHQRNDVLERVGDSGPVGAYEVFNPFATGFAAMSFRPQHMVEGEAMATHNPQIPRDILLRDEARRPAVLRAHAWGAQAGADWAYTVPPEHSSSRGGAAEGGLLFAPPELGMWDMLDGRTATPAAPSHYVTMADGVALALGSPNTQGSVAVRTSYLWRDSSADLKLTQLDTGGTARDLLTARTVGSGGEREVTFEGSTGIVLPRGTTAQRPTTPSGGAIRMATNRVSGQDTPEIYNQQASAWERISTEDPSSSGVQVSVSNTTSFLTVHTSVIPQNGLGNNGAITFTIIGDILVNAVGNPQIRIVWNGTTIQTITHTWTSGTSATAKPFHITGTLGNLTVSSAQYLTGQYNLGGETGVIGVALSSFTSADTASAELELSVQASWTVASTALVFRKLHSHDRIVRR